MSSPEFYLAAPTEQEKSASVAGLTFDDFKALSDEQIELLGLELEAELQTSLRNDAYWDITESLEIYRNFAKWRKHGQPDRNISYGEINERLRHQVTVRKETDPTYGIVTSEDIVGYTAEEEAIIDFFLERYENYSYGATARQHKHHLPSNTPKQLTYDRLVEIGLLERSNLEDDGVRNRQEVYTLTNKFVAYILFEYYYDFDRTPPWQK